MIGDRVQTSTGEGIVVAVDRESACVRMDSKNDKEGYLDIFPKSAIKRLQSAVSTLNNLHIRYGSVNATIAVSLGADSIDIKGVRSVDIKHDADELPITTLSIWGYPSIGFRD